MSNIHRIFALNWQEVDALREVRHNNPHHILGMHQNLNDLYINVYYPGAKSVVAIDEYTNEKYQLISNREYGFYTINIKNKIAFPYKLRVTLENSKVLEYYDPYSFEPVIDGIDISKFNEGTHYSIYEKLGSHPMIVDGIKGTLFAVWAPNASRISVVGDFNNWDGRIHLMRRMDYSGIFELFIPQVKDGSIYKYEICDESGNTFLKSDLYANGFELRPKNSSKVTEIKFDWTDNAWINHKSKLDKKSAKVSIYEVHLGSWMKPEDGREFYSYKEIAKKLASYVIKMGYNYIELMPVMEHPLDASWGYQVTGYFAPTSRYGSANDFAYFVNYLHSKGIGIIMDWVPAHFPKDDFGLGKFDGTALYEAMDSRRGEHPHWGTYIFDYGRPEIKNFLISNALFWVKKFHIDGIRVDAVASMLYLDYGKQGGQWLPNIYGGNEYFEAVEFIKELNTIIKEEEPSTLMIAEESTAWPKVTHPIVDGGLGFDYKWNMGWMNDFINYMKVDPRYRKDHHNELTFSMMYAYNEDFVLVISHDEVVHLKKSMIGKMPGGYEDKFSNLRAAYGFMMTHPGKKLLFMGQEIGQLGEFDENSQVDWSCFEFDANVFLQKYMQDLNKLYLNEGALTELDNKEEGFKWISCDDAKRSLVSFVRFGKDSKDTLVVVCNFSLNEYNNYELMVPYKGKWSEIFSSNNEKYGGDGIRNKTIKEAKESVVDKKEYSINVVIPHLSVTIFKQK